MSELTESDPGAAAGVNDIVARVRRGEVRAVARLISALENSKPEARPVLRRLFPLTGRAYVIGVTGSPGAGKSTLVDRIAHQARADGRSVAVLAVDPSSPFTGGAVLGDRIRMQAHAGDPGVFIRSMGARGYLGGLAQSTRDALRVLDSAGYELILVETVGVGQSELDIAGAADTTLVVVTPDMGDAVQTLKAGILEIADVFALNKADHADAPRMHRALSSMLHLQDRHEWNAEIVETRAHEGQGIQALYAALDRHRAWLERTGGLTERRDCRLRREVRELVERGLRTSVAPRLLAASGSESVLQAVIDHVVDPADGADRILQLAVDVAFPPPAAAESNDGIIEDAGQAANLPY